jgi:hypothetical protein
MSTTAATTLFLMNQARLIFHWAFYWQVTQPFCQVALQAKLDFFCHQVLRSGLDIPPKDLYHGKLTPGAVLYLEPGLTCNFFRTLSLFHSVCTVIETFMRSLDNQIVNGTLAVICQDFREANTTGLPVRPANQCES